MSSHLPEPSHYPSYRKASEKENPTFRGEAHRTRSALSFAHGADTYHDVRPSYPGEVAELIADAHAVLDVGAGTGKLTETLTNLQVLACDPSPDMTRVLREQLGVPTWRSVAESTALGDASVDAVACAQTWHWVDVAKACGEFDRIVRPGGKVLLVWNTLDVGADPWLLRLARIMHSGDIQRPGFYPEVSAPWEITKELRLKWNHILTPEQLHQLMHTRSYWLRNTTKIHDRMTHNLNWYLYEHMGFSEGQALEIAYRTDAFVLTRAVAA
ncbi:class I SAM-dependent methyltransferase [Corynebacterium striatum]|uniref:class I SAM-dependent methyltransferase n=1 Tax=Corynebacterium striatum TaxID=43770 RepID=UPI0006671348|nr:class I SAM-dependent methyltransferase [Corynebacterium striatum]CQD04764.1 SAM-dependent methyltransferase [Corynebacterium striatum]HAT1138054.1 class I SAM-dependent methyltransferase [Corynebacterium striatum]HAT1158721.1 class I SAM-dependent methyltransferase [Corynebacterium striatum]HAT1161272.1 class I SAM-dependent methyltransferase [Corynebacterium striatum]HAT1164161.1 class I SAM-dependent methyltransferase [Corynebacterium striatum]